MVIASSILVGILVGYLSHNASLGFASTAGLIGISTLIQAVLFGMGLLGRKQSP